MDLSVLTGGDLHVVIRRGAAELNGTLATPEPDEYPELPYSLTLIPDNWSAAAFNALPQTMIDNTKKLEFAVKNLAPGNYAVVTLPAYNGSLWENPDFIRAMQVEGVRVTLQKGERKRVAVSFVPSSRIHAIRLELGI